MNVYHDLPTNAGLDCLQLPLPESISGVLNGAGYSCPPKATLRSSMAIHLPIACRSQPSPWRQGSGLKARVVCQALHACMHRISEVLDSPTTMYHCTTPASSFSLSWNLTCGLDCPLLDKAHAAWVVVVQVNNRFPTRDPAAQQQSRG